MDTVRNAWDLATDKITGREMCVKTEDAAIISIAALIGGSVGTALLPQLAVLGYMIGSVVGTIISEVKKCTNYGTVCFDRHYFVWSC